MFGTRSPFSVVVFVCCTLASGSPRAALHVDSDWHLPKLFGSSLSESSGDGPAPPSNDVLSDAGSLRGGRTVHKHKSVPKDLPVEDVSLEQDARLVDTEEATPPPAGSSANPETAPAGTSANPEKPADVEDAPSSVALASILPEVLPDEQMAIVQSSAADLDMALVPAQGVADMQDSEGGTESSALVSAPIDGRSDAEVSEEAEAEVAKMAAEISAEEVESQEAAAPAADTEFSETPTSVSIGEEIGTEVADTEQSAEAGKVAASAADTEFAETPASGNAGEEIGAGEEDTKQSMESGELASSAEDTKFAESPASASAVEDIGSEVEDTEQSADSAVTDEVYSGEMAASSADAELAETPTSASAVEEIGAEPDGSEPDGAEQFAESSASQAQQLATSQEATSGYPTASGQVEDIENSPPKVSPPLQVPDFGYASSSTVDAAKPDAEDLVIAVPNSLSESVAGETEGPREQPADGLGRGHSVAGSFSAEDDEGTPEMSEDAPTQLQSSKLSVPSADSEAESIAAAESPDEIPAGESELLIDRADLLKERTALQNEKEGIEDVKTKLAEQIESAQAKQEAKEAQDRVWLQKEKKSLERTAAQLQANASLLEAVKTEEFERKKAKLEEENGRLKERFEGKMAKLEQDNRLLEEKASHLKETRDNVVRELKRSVDQNQEMRKLMEDIRDDQLRSASEMISDNASTTGLARAKTGSVPKAAVSPVLAVKHISQTGSSTIMSLLARMTQQLPSFFPGHGEFFRYVDELDPVPLKTDASDDFVISSVRNPCDWYVSLWAFSSRYDVEALKGLGTVSDPEPFFGDIHNASKFANWLQWSQGKWSDLPTQADCNSVMSLRYWEALKSGHHVGGMNERGYNGATLDKYSAFFDGKPRERIEEDLKALNPSADVDCWVTTENLMDDLSACLKEYERRSGVELDWQPFSEMIAAGTATPEQERDECDHYYTPELAESVRRHDRHMFEAFGYNSCCGARADTPTK